jgi:hypothetical protein
MWRGITYPLLADIVCEALTNVDPSTIRLSPLRYDERPHLRSPKFQERTFAYEFYHQLRKLQEAGREELQGMTQQGEVSKQYQGVPFVPDLLLHVPGEQGNFAAFEFKLAGNRDMNNDLFKLQYLKVDFGYREAFMIIVGSEREAATWLAKARQLESASGEEICFIVYDPVGSERIR